MNILVTLDRNYLEPLHIMLFSLFCNNPGERFAVYMVGDGLLPEDVNNLQKLCEVHGACLHPVALPEGRFAQAPVVRYYSRAMYYRLLAADLLPASLDRVLYIDPDILVLGAVRPLYETDLQGNIFAAASHSGLTKVTEYVNKVRLDNRDAEGYFNSGVLLMDLAAMRERVKAEEIFAYAREHEDALLLPDQDILNALYGEKILPLQDAIWNYDARNYSSYLLRSGDVYDMQWVMQHTAILHFCGREKPWKPGYIHRFGILYQHYMQLARRAWQICL